MTTKDTSGAAAGKTVLVTGASGFLAQHVVLALLKRGYTVRGSVRTLAKGEATRKVLAKHDPRAADITFVALDLTKDAGWDAACAGCDFVLHTASPIPAVLPKNEDDLIVPARDGTLRVLKAARDAKVARVVKTSSVAAVMYGHASLSRTFTEDDWSDETNLTDSTAYIRSKTIAEKEAWAFMRDAAPDLELTTILPSAIMGPILSNDFSTSIELITQTMGGKIPAMPKLGYQMVDVRDVAEAHVLAMEHPDAAGERFIVADKFLWFSDTADLMRTEFPAYAKKITKRSMPSFVLRILARFNPVMKQVVLELDRQRSVSSDKAREMLGWFPRSSEDAIIAAAQSVIEHGALD